MSDKTAHEYLAEIQKNLNAPKGQTNTFGKYKYRNCEDILTALKPLLGECTITLSDEIVMIGDRFYVKATARLDASNTCVSVSAYAREDVNKKGMDLAQITGSTSSYARKYALNGLFAIDDTKDADSMDNRQQGAKQQTQVKINPAEYWALDANAKGAIWPKLDFASKQAIENNAT